VRAVVLAAGRGTRMGELSQDRPKHLIPLDGKPVMEHVVLGLREAGIFDIVMVIGHLGHMIREHFQDGSKLGVSIRYAIQDRPTGTGSAVHAARELAFDAPFLMAFGDLITVPETYRNLVDCYESSPCDALLLLNWVEDPHRGAAVYFDDAGSITHIVEKPPIGTSTTHWNHAGMYVFSQAIFNYTADLTPSFRGEYELVDAVNAMIRDGRVIRGHKLTSSSWCDVGTPGDVEKAEKIVAG
jgi:dTDP-glucose pyrophosphorylase